MSKNTRTRILLTAVAALLLVVMTVGGTIAYLQDATKKVTNTFTTSNIDIKLEEGQNLDLHMVPGKELTKNPLVTVINGSEACWLFVKLEKSEGFDTYLQYEMADGWTVLPSDASVYYRKVDAVSADTEFQVIKGNKVTVKSEVTNAQMDAVESENPTLTISAYAIQQLKFDNVADAWTEVSKLSNDNDYYTTTTDVQGTKVTVTP